MDLYSWLLAAGFWLGAFACVPPTWRVVRRRSARDYSWAGFGISLVCMTCVLVALAGTRQWVAFAAQSGGYAAMWIMVGVKVRTEIWPGQRADTKDLEDHARIPVYK